MDTLETPAAPLRAGTTAASRAGAWLAWGLWAITAAQVGGGLLLAALNRLSFERLLAEYVAASAATALAFATVGALVAQRRPQNRMAWLICAAGLVGGLGAWAGQYARYALVTRPGALPLGDLAAWLYICPAFGPFVGLVAIFIPLLFPSGRLPSPRWRPVGALALVATTLFTVVLAISPGPVDASLPEVNNPFGLPGAEPLLRWLEPATLVLMLASLAGAVAAPVARFRRARGAERQQLKWFAFASALLVAAIVVPGAAGYPDFDQGSTLISGAALALALPLLPLAIGAAILRYRLWEIDLLISRALVYALLSACVVAIYVLVVGGLGALLQRSGSLPAALIATGVVAVLFAPLRERLQRAVNRLVYGERDDPYAVVARLGQRLEAALAPDEVLPALVETVAGALRLPYAAITLLQDGAFVLAAEAGSNQTGRQGDRETIAAEMPISLSPPLLVSLSLTYQGETVGELRLAPRPGDDSFSPADRRLLAVLARQAGVAAHAVRLTRDLQQAGDELRQARALLIAAREEERRRIRRDLHDGVGPVLSSLVQRLDLARGTVRRDPEAAAALLDALKGEVRATLADIRRLVYALRPPSLDELGLVAAIREQAALHHQSGALEVTIDAPDLPPLPAAVELAAYRIALEGLTNVVRHAQARRCEIHLSLAGAGEPRALCLEVIDDGIGLGADARAGVGLASMRERADELGGTWLIDRAPRGGTRLVAWLPLPD
jgi:signal transduction histidine kinase